MSVETFQKTSFQTLDQWAKEIDGAISVLSRVAAMFAPREEELPRMSVRVDAGSVFDPDNNIVEIGAQSVTVPPLDPVSVPRIDRVVVGRETGIAEYRTGDAEGPPQIDVKELSIARVAVSPGISAITNSMITDERNPFAPTPGPGVFSPCYAQFEAGADLGQIDFHGGKWTPIPWNGASVNQGIQIPTPSPSSPSSPDITFSQAGVYRISVTCRIGGLDRWTAMRLFDNGTPASTLGQSAGFGAGGNTFISAPTFLARVPGAGTYRIEVGRNASVGNCVPPENIGGVTPPILIATLEKIAD